MLYVASGAGCLFVDNCTEVDWAILVRNQDGIAGDAGRPLVSVREGLDVGKEYQGQMCFLENVLLPVYEAVFFSFRSRVGCDAFKIVYILCLKGVKEFFLL